MTHFVGTFWNASAHKLRKELQTSVAVSYINMHAIHIRMLFLLVKDMIRKLFFDKNRSHIYPLEPI